MLYLLTILPPNMPECEALSQEISALRTRFGGDFVTINPNRSAVPPWHRLSMQGQAHGSRLSRFMYVPRLLFGLHKLRALRALAAKHELCHLYNPDPFPFPVLHLLRRPVIYTVSSGLGKRRPNVAFFNALATVTVYDARSQKQLEGWGVRNVHRIPPGIDTGRFTCTPVPLSGQAAEFRVLVASAPWTQTQFRTKGVDALLDAARQAPNLKLIFLWRGVLVEEMLTRVHRMALGEQVQVINRQVDVNQVLAQVHATISLASDPAIIKAYPHALLDSLAAGKPVLVSRALPMSDYVEQVGCGKVIASVSAADILEAIQALRRDYGALQASAQLVGQRDFPLEKTLSAFQEVYEYVRTNVS